MAKLAINGGKSEVAKKMIKHWPPIGALDRSYVLQSLRGGAHAFGPNCSRFEAEFAQWNGNKYAITANSGTAAMHMCVAACGVGAGDQVIVPAYSWSSSATCVIHHNAVPVFVDMDFDTMNIDPDLVEQAITPRTKAIIVVHLHGLTANMGKIMRIARRHKLKVIEDACQAHGAMFKGKKAGLLGDCAAFSFNQNKCLCSGEGGMFVTNNKAIYQSAMQLWSFGETRSPIESRDYHAYALGWMYRNNDLSAAFGRAQLTRLSEYQRILRGNAQVLLKGLAGIKGLILPVEPAGYTHNWYNFTCRLDPKQLGWTGDPVCFRDAVMKALQAEGVPVGVWQHFILPAMTVFQAKNAYGKGCPWSCPYGRDVTYDPKAFPVAQRHCDNHFGMTNPLRAPNGPAVARAVAGGFRKVFDNINQLDVDKVLGAQK